MTTTNVVENRKRYSGQGTVAIAELDANFKPGPFYELGRITDVGSQAKLQIYEERNTEDGSRALDLRIIQGKDFEGEMTLESYKPSNLALRYYGKEAVVDAGTVTDEELGPLVIPEGGDPEDAVATLVADQLVYTAFQNITTSGTPAVTTLVLTDSTPTTPKTLDSDNYTLVDAAFGKIRVLDVSGLVMPIKAAYSYGETVAIPIHKENQLREFALRFEMLNTFDDSKLLIVLYRVNIEPNGMNALIQEKGVDAGKVKFTALIDPNAAADADLGRFGYIKVL